MDRQYGIKVLPVKRENKRVGNASIYPTGEIRINFYASPNGLYDLVDERNGDSIAITVLAGRGTSDGEMCEERKDI